MASILQDRVFRAPIRLKPLLANAVFFFGFFPFLKLIPAIKAEVQPISGVIGLLAVLLFRIKRNIYTALAGLFILLVMFHLFLFLLRERTNEYGLLFDGFGYLVPPLIFLAVYDRVSLLSVKVFWLTLGAYLLVGILQHFNALPDFIESFFTTLIPRFRTTSLGGPRGVAFLAPEPSYSAFVIVLFLATAHYFRATDRITRKSFFMVLLIVMIMLLLNKSGSGLLFLSIYSLGYLVGLFATSRKRIAGIIKVMLVALTMVVSGIFFGIVGESLGKLHDARFVRLTFDLIELVKSEQPATYILSEVGAKRFLTVIAGYYGVFESHGLGHGIGSWSRDLERLAAELGFSRSDLPYPVVTPEKPDSYASQVALDMGLPGLLLITLFLGRLTFDTVRSEKKRVTSSAPSKYAMLCVAIFMIVFYSTTAMPTPWIILCYVYDLNKKTSGKSWSLPRAGDTPPRGAG